MDPPGSQRLENPAGNWLVLPIEATCLVGDQAIEAAPGTSCFVSSCFASC